MSNAIIILLMALWFTSLSMAQAAPRSFDLENPDAALMEKESEILKRTLYLTSPTSDCSGTWLETSIVVTANHCVRTIEHDAATGRNYLQLGAVRTEVLYSTHAEDKEYQPLDIGGTVASLESDAALRDSDVMVLAVDPQPLSALPSTALSLPEPTDEPLPVKDEVLIAGYGLTSLMINRAGEVLNDGIPFGKRTLGAAKFVAERALLADKTPNAGVIRVSATRRVVATSQCASGQAMVTSEKPELTPCPMRIEIRSTTKKTPMILSGDSGGPGFRRQGDRWVLAGVTSAIGFRTFELDSFAVKVQADEAEAQVQSVGVPDAFWKRINAGDGTGSGRAQFNSFKQVSGLAQFLFGSALVYSIFPFDEPLLRPVSLSAEWLGFLFGDQTHLGYRPIHDALQARLKTLREAMPQLLKLRKGATP